MIITIVTCASSSSTLRWPNLAEQKSVRQEFILIGELRNLRFILYFQHPMVFEICETWVSFCTSNIQWFLRFAKPEFPFILPTSNGVWDLQNLSFIFMYIQWCLRFVKPEFHFVQFPMVLDFNQVFQNFLAGSPKIGWKEQMAKVELDLGGLAGT